MLQKTVIPSVAEGSVSCGSASRTAYGGEKNRFFDFAALCAASLRMTHLGVTQREIPIYISTVSSNRVVSSIFGGMPKAW